MIYLRLRRQALTGLKPFLNHFQAANGRRWSSRITIGFQSRIGQSVERVLQTVALHTNTAGHFFIGSQVGVLVVIHTPVFIARHVACRAGNSRIGFTRAGQFILPKSKVG